MKTEERTEAEALASSARLYSQAEYLRALLRSQLDILAGIEVLLALATPPTAESKKPVKKPEPKAAAAPKAAAKKPAPKKTAKRRTRKTAE